MRNIKFKSWDDYKSNVKKKLLSSSGKKDLNDFLFRGQADSSWPLKSSFDRIETDKSKYKELIINFEKICKNYNYQEELLKISDKEKNIIAAYGQHYGLPTRLLDWTRSPYFAIFFAFSTAMTLKLKTKQCTVWAINKNSESEKKSGGLDFVELSTNKYNYRIKNQLGHFTLSKHTEDSIDDYDSTLCKKFKENDLLWKMDINYSSISAVMEDLEDMGITYGIAYPDNEGFIKQAMYLTRLGT